MRKSAIFFLAACMISGNAANAQLLHSEANPFFNIIRQVAQANQRSRSSAPARPTAEISRLSSLMSSQYDGSDFVEMDSVRFYWSGNRGGNDFLDYAYRDDLNFDSAVEVYYDDLTLIWEPTTKVIQEMNGQDQKTNKSILGWDDPNSAWVNGSRSLYTLDGAGQPVEIISQGWVSGAWENSSKTINTYAGSNCTQTIIQYWNSGTNSWDNNGKISRIFNADDQLEGEIHQSWDGASWANTSKDMYAYNSDGDNHQLIHQLWDGASWENDTKTLNAFTDHNVTETIYQEWNGADWEHTEKVLLSYNSFDQFLTMESQSWNPGNFWETNVNDYRYSCIYETFNTSAIPRTEQRNSRIALYPNPAVQEITVSLENGTFPRTGSLLVYDIQGKLCLQQGLDQQRSAVRVELYGYAPGTYFLKIEGGGLKECKAFQIVK